MIILKMYQKVLRIYDESIEMFVTMKQENLKDILALENKISNQKDVIRFLDLIMQNQIKTITWDVKNAIDHLKLEQGSL